MTQNELEIHDRGNHILIDFFGEFSREAGKRCFDSMVEACDEFGRSTVLLDCRKMTGQPGILDRFLVMEYGQITHRTISRLALVSRQENILPDRFEEHVAVNRGVNLRIFTDIEAALAWLRS
jgi:hypothetical protein